MSLRRILADEGLTASRRGEPDFEDLAYRLNKALRPHYKYEANELKDSYEDGEALVDRNSSKNDPDFARMKRLFPELDWSHWSDTGAVGQDEWFLTGYLHR
jgi:hypothetical protein